MSLKHAVSVFSFILVLGGVCSSAWADSEFDAGACWEWLEMPHDGYTEEVCHCASDDLPVCVHEGTVVARCLSGKEDGEAGGEEPTEGDEDASEAPSEVATAACVAPADVMLLLMLRAGPALR